MPYGNLAYFKRRAYQEGRRQLVNYGIRSMRKYGRKYLRGRSRRTYKGGLRGTRKRKVATKKWVKNTIARTKGRSKKVDDIITNEDDFNAVNGTNIMAYCWFGNIQPIYGGRPTDRNGTGVLLTGFRFKGLFENLKNNTGSDIDVYVVKTDQGTVTEDRMPQNVWFQEYRHTPIDEVQSKTLPFNNLTIPDGPEKANHPISRDGYTVLKHIRVHLKPRFSSANSTGNKNDWMKHLDFYHRFTKPVKVTFKVGVALGGANFDEFFPKIGILIAAHSDFPQAPGTVLAGGDDYPRITWYFRDA